MQRTGRNALCPCGSGKKYKHCCAQGSASAAPPIHSQRLIVTEALDLAFEHQRAGRTLDAMRVCHEILAQVPDQPDAIDLLGVLTFTQGQADVSLELLRKAISLNPVNPSFHNNLGGVLHSLGRLDEAAACYREAIVLAPDFATAYANLATVLKHQNRLDEAIASCNKAIDLKPDHVNAHNILGTVLASQHRFDEAIACYKAALSFQPEHANVNLNLGAAFASVGRFDEALARYKKALSIKPDSAEAHFNLAQLLMRCGKLEAAADYFRQALALKPNLAAAHNNLATLMKKEGRLDETLAGFQRALALEPDNPLFHSNLLLYAQYSPDLSPPGLFAEHLRFAQRFEWPLIPTWRPHTNSRDPERPLRVGYVSGDYFDHAVAFFIEPVLASHDKSQVETFCYYNNDRHEAMTNRIMALADHWLPCQELSDDQLAERIRADGIDILVDLSGHTGKNRLLVFARKPAPVQATWIGYPGTTGLVAMDYRITDAYMDPPGLTECYHSEQLIRLPGSGAAYRPAQGCPSVNELPATTEGVFTFASLNNLAKVNPSVIALWGRLLTALPKARLMIGNASEPSVRRRLLEAFGKVGIAEERLWLQPRMPLLDYFALYHRIDLALDPFPYNGGTTTNDSLWMGVPVITLAGENMVSRCGVTLLSRVGLTDFIVRSEEEYLQRALQFAQDLPELNRIRQSLRGRMDEGSSNGAESITRHLEDAYRDMWRKWCASTP